MHTSHIQRGGAGVEPGRGYTNHVRAGTSYRRLSSMSLPLQRVNRARMQRGLDEIRPVQSPRCMQGWPYAPHRGWSNDDERLPSREWG
jgi:hypothetical protein